MRVFCVCVLLCCGAAAGDAAPAGPLEKLTGLCGGTGTPIVAKLKETYLELQWARLTGKAELPELAEDVKEALKKKQDPLEIPKAERKRGRRLLSSAPLKDDEIAKLEAWFKAQPKFRETFLLALNPFTDDMPAAARVALLLREKFPKDVDPLQNLVVAFAVVWDSPETVKHMATDCVPELYSKPPVVCPFDESFGWYAKHQNELTRNFAQTPWRLLKYVTPEANTLAERDWALGKVLEFFKDQKAKIPGPGQLGKCYEKIEYDDSKLVNDIGKLGKNPYTLANLQKYGGVCRDQAFFARALCRAYGIPSYMATGTGIDGGLHAWVGWVPRQQSGFTMEDFGRYKESKYFTAEITAPDSGELILDYTVGIEVTGLANEATYAEADLLYRVWEECGAKLQPEQRSRLLTEALKRNVRHRLAWLAVGEAVAAGELPKSSAEGQWTYLTTSFKQYPDFVVEMLENFSHMNKEAQAKERFFNIATTFFKELKRDDLIAALRLKESDAFAAEKNDALAAAYAEIGTVECGGNGEWGLKLAKRAVELMRKLKREKGAIEMLNKVLPKIPKGDEDDINPNYVAVLTMLRELYKDTGNSAKEAEMKEKLAEVKGGKRK